MRFPIAALSALALCACGQPAPPSSPLGCAREATHTLTWSNPAAPDVVTARADGPSCAQAVVTLTLRNASGDPLWTFAAPHYAMTGAESLPPEGLPALTPEQIDAFLASWADLTEMRTGALPAWRPDAASLSQSAPAFSYDTPFDRDVYEALRARDLPMLCYAAGAETSTCLIVDPASGAPARMVSFGP